MFKKIIAIIMSIVTVLCMLTTLSGCGKKTDESISKGELLLLIADGFGMYSYSQEEPYTNTVDSDNEYFPYVQIAYEWGIIDDKDINVESKATKGFLAETLVNCVGNIDTQNMSEEEITDYALENEYVSFNYRGRTDNIRNITRTEAEESIALSFNVWTNRQIENKEEVVVNENVCNLSDGDLTSDQVYVNEKDKTIMIPEEVAREITEGEDFVLPANNVDTTASAYKAEKIEYVNGYAIIEYNDATLEETIEDLKFSGSTQVNFNNVPITDGVGNVINANAISGVSTDSSSLQTNTLSLTSKNGNNVKSCANMSLGFEVDGLEISGQASGSSLSFSVKGEIPVGKKKKIPVAKSYEVSNIDMDWDYDMDGFKLKYAYAKLNYTVKDTTSVKFVDFDKEGAVDFDHRKKPTLSNILNSSFTQKAAEKGAKTIKIASFPIVNGGVGRIDVDIKIKISISGSIELVVTTHHANGVEYKNGNIRYIKQKDNDIDLNIKAKIEATLYAGVAIKVLKFNLVGVGFEGGIGVEFKAITHLVNSSNVKVDELSIDGGNFEYVHSQINLLQNLSFDGDGKPESYHIDLCGQITTYLILRFKVDDDCALADIISGKTKEEGNKIKLELEIFGSDNAKIDALCWHIEDWKFIKECTRKYGENEEDNEEESTSEDASENTSENTLGGSVLDIDTYFFNMLIGNTTYITVTKIPDGFLKADVEFTSSNPDVAAVDSSGKVTAISEGEAEITAKINGTDFSVKCYVVVNSADNHFLEFNIPKI